MIRRLCMIAMIATAACAATGCAKNLFGLNLFVVGEKTSLERQVLGNYAEIGRDLSAYASVRGVDPNGALKPAPKKTESQTQVLQAFSNRKYNRDDLDTLLVSGVVGEGRDGLLSTFGEEPTAVAQLSPALITELLEEENRDRATILERLMRTTPGVHEDDRAEVAWIFATLNQDLAPKGARLQTKSGDWKTK